MIRRFIHKKVMYLLVVGALFLVFLPMAVWDMEPHSDLAYHLLQPEVITLGADDEMSDDLHAEVFGLVEIDSIQVVTHWRSLEGFFLTVEGSPRHLFVWVDADLHPLGESLAECVAIRGLVTPTLVPACASQVLAQPVSLQGRVYDGHDDFIDPFVEFAGRDDNEPEEYVEKHFGERISTTPRWVEWLDPPKQPSSEWWMLVAGEEPAASQLMNTHLPVFVLGSTLGAMALFVGFWWFRDREKPENSDPGKPAGAGEGQSPQPTNFTQRVAQKAQITEEEARLYTAHLIECIHASLDREETVQIDGLGRFYVRTERESRIRIAFFKADKTLHALLNQEQDNQDPTE